MSGLGMVEGRGFSAMFPSSKDPGKKILFSLAPMAPGTVGHWKRPIALRVVTAPPTTYLVVDVVEALVLAHRLLRHGEGGGGSLAVERAVHAGLVRVCGFLND